MKIKGYEIGPKAKLQGADLRKVYLEFADLSGADLRKANLQGANLKCTNLKGADLRGANLLDVYAEGTNFQDAYMQCANLQDGVFKQADLTGANLRCANLKMADFPLANFQYANLKTACLEMANLREANLKCAQLPHFQICPEEGSFIGWKKVMNEGRGVVIKLLIPEDAKRTSSLVGRKCRASHVIVLSGSGHSGRSMNFRYEEGQTIEADDYNDDIRIECTNGIHFFITKKEAEEYHL